MASTETIMPKIIQRPAVSQIEKRPMVEKTAPIDAPGVIKVMANSDVPPTKNNNESFNSDNNEFEKEEKNDDPHNMMSISTNSAAENTVDANGSEDDTYTSQVVAEAAAPSEEWNPLEEVDSALLTALCDSKERKALIRLESVLVDFMKDASLASIDVGGAFNSIVVGLVQQQSSSADENTTTNTTSNTSGNEEDATTFVSSHSLGLQDLQNQYSRGVRQTSFQRLILHRLADRFNIVREQINNVNPAAATSPSAAVANDRNTSERGLVDVGGNNNYNNNMNNNNWSAPQQQQQMTYPLGLIRLIKTEESCIPAHLLNNLDLSLLVNYKNPRARNYAPNNNNINNNNTNADDGMRTLSDNMNGASLDNNNMSVMPGPKKPNKKMVIMKRNSSSNTSGSGDGLANGKRESRSRRKKLEDREKAYEEARARIFGKEAAAAEGVLEDQESDAAIQENAAPPSTSCHSSFSVEDDGPLVRPPSADMDGSGHISAAAQAFVPSQLISGTTPNKARSASSSPEPQASNSQPASPREVEGGEQKQGQATSRTKAVYRNPQQEANDPDFRRRSAYVPATPMGVVPNGCMPHGVPYNMVNPYAMNPYAAVSSGQHPHVMMQQQTPVFYPHPGHPTPQDPQSLQYPYSQPRAFYPGQQPPQVQQVQKQSPQVQQVQIRPKEQQHVQQKPRPIEQKVQRAQSYEPRTSDSTNVASPPTPPEKTVPQENNSQPTIKQPTWGPNAQAQAYEPSSSNSTNVAPPPPPEKTVPRENDSKPTIKQPTWGPNAQLPKEVKTAAPVVPKASPVKKVAPPAKSNEKKEESIIPMYKEEDFPALG